MFKSGWFVLILLLLLSFARPADVLLAHPPDLLIACEQPNPDPTDPSATVCISQDIVYVNGASPQNKFSVSWVTATPQTGQVHLVGGANFGDVRGSGFSGITHYVTLGNLQPNTTYQFDIVSGGTTFDNNGAHWSINTGPVLAQPKPDYILGNIENPDGTYADDAVVYVTISRADGSGSSSLLSDSLDSSSLGSFHISLADARTADNSGAFTYNKSTDLVTITALGPGGMVSTTVATNVPRPGHPITLVLGSGVINYGTPTPSPIPPTVTSTPVTPSMTPTQAPGTATALAATQTAASFTATATSTLPPPPTDTPELPTPTSPVPAATLTNAAITIAPADQTLVAEATLSATEAAAVEPTITRAVRPTPPTSAAFGGIVTRSFILLAFSALAFAGAVVLGGAAIYLWRK